MRTFSKLKAFCSFPETLPDKPSKRRDDAAALGTLFHSYIEEWVQSGRDGWQFSCEDAPEPVATWIRRMRQKWTPPPGVETEVCLGLEDLPFPQHVPVVEEPPRSHKYVAVDGRTPVLTAGRSDLQWVEESILNVADIKTGQFYLGPPARLRQLQAQGFAAFSRAFGIAPPEGAGFRVGIYYARTGYFDWSDIIRPGTPEWDQAWRECLDAAKRDQEPHPGAHCLSCYDKAACQANPEREAA